MQNYNTSGGNKVITELILATVSEFLRKNNKKCILCITFFIVVSLLQTAYAKYIIIKEFNINSNSPMFYLESQIDKNSEKLNVNKVEFVLDAQNYISENEFNMYDTSYQITEDSEKFDIELVDLIIVLLNQEKITIKYRSL